MAALRVLDLLAPRTQLLCCACSIGAKRKRLFLRSVLRTVGTKNGLWPDMALHQPAGVSPHVHAHSDPRSGCSWEP